MYRLWRVRGYFSPIAGKKSRGYHSRHSSIYCQAGGRHGKKIGVKEGVFFDGGSAFNKGLKCALERELNVDVYVPPDPQITTALGAAIIAYENYSKRHITV